ncbi:Lon protease [uncultured archaeon]|nr:Lon protease [uncultured archaeon]
MINKILLVIIVVLMSASSIHALEGGVTVPLVADRSTTDGGDEGVLLGATVIVQNGTGHVFVDTSPYTQVDLQGSARLAAMVASDEMGVDQKAYDFYYIIDISSPIIGGPSAGGALTVATIAAMNKWTLKPGVVMTGMINPDGSIGPVGGIPFKLEAAAAKNTSLFLIPEGQSTVTVQKTITTKKGAFEYFNVKEETVDVIELGKKLNVEVKEVGTIQDVVLAFTGNTITKPEINGTVLTSNYLDLLEPLATSMKQEANGIYEGAAASNPQGPLIVQSKDILDRAETMYKDQKYYAATSLYFQAMFNMRTSNWNDGYARAADKEQYLMELVNKVDTQINSSETALESFKSYGVSDVSAIGAAESRIMAARVKLDEARKTNNSDEKIASLAFANERARTAQWWLTLAIPTDKVIPENILKDRAGWYLSQAKSINTYMIELVTESGGHPGGISGSSEDIDNAEREMQRGYYAGAIFDSLQATVKSSTTIGLFGKVDTAKKSEQSRDAAKAAINDARLAGIEPTLAVSAYEWAETMTAPYDQIFQYSYAKMVAETSTVLNSHSVTTNKTPIKPVLPPYVPEALPSPAATATETKSQVPAFEAVTAALAIILVASRLKRN